MPESPTPQAGAEPDRDSSPSRDQDAFFRPEAVEYHETDVLRHGQGRVVRIVPPWSGPAVWALLGVGLLGVLAGMLIDVGEYATGPVRINGDATYVAVLPEAALSPLKHGQHLEVRAGPGGRVSVDPNAAGIRPVDDATAANLLGPPASDSLASMSRSLVAVEGRLPASGSTPPGGVGDARVRVRSQPFLWVLLSDLNPSSGAP